MNLTKISIFLAITVLSLALGLALDFNTCTFDLSRFNYSLAWQIIDWPSIFLIALPTLSYTALFWPKGKKTSSVITHLSSISCIAFAFGWAYFFIGIIFMLSDMRPETIGPNLAISLLTVLYAFIINIFLTLAKNILEAHDRDAVPTNQH